MKQHPSKMSEQDYIEQEVNHARQNVARNRDCNGNPIKYPDAYISKTRDNAIMRYALRGRDSK